MTQPFLYLNTPDSMEAIILLKKKPTVETQEHRGEWPCIRVSVTPILDRMTDKIGCFS